MKIDSLEKTNENKSSSLLVIIIITIIAGLMIAGLINGVIFGVKNITLLAIKYWVWILGGVGVLLLLRKIFFRTKVQPVRVVR